MSKQVATLLQRALTKKKKDFKGFSLRWMAAQLDVSHVYLSHIIRGLRPIPLGIVEPLCEILDLDEEYKAKVFHASFKAKGYRPLSESKKARMQKEVDWRLIPQRDFDLLSRWETNAILLSTLLDSYDGTASFIAERLFLPEVLVVSIMDLLEEKGHLVQKSGRRVASENFYEYQTQSSREQLAKYHKSVLQKAANVLDHKKEEIERERRLITSAAMTCSKADVARLKDKIADFIREFSAEAAVAPQADDVYQLGIQFFPVTSK